MSDRPRSPVALATASDDHVFGGKAAQLAAAARAGLPVPAGIAVPWELVDAVADGDRDAAAVLRRACAHVGDALAVRSSAVGEDSAVTSFAGQHRSLLNVVPDRVADAVCAVRRSAHGEPAHAYRRRLGVPGAVRVGVVVQKLVDADAAGVLFCPNPVTGAREMVIESAWGLGEAVVSGLVTPDQFRLGLDGEVLERRCGTKDLQVRPAAGSGGTATCPVPAERVRALSLDVGGLAELHRLATRCTDVFGGSQDLEWAWAGKVVWLLQRRAVTTAAP